MAPKATPPTASKRYASNAPPKKNATEKKKAEAPVSASPPKKRFKAEALDPKESDRKAVVEAIQSANQLPESCRSMLSAMTSSLMQPARERGELPLMFVDMIDEALHGQRVALEKAIVDEEATCARVAGSFELRKKSVDDAEAAVQAEIANSKVKSEALATATQAVKAAETAALEAMAKRNELLASLQSATEDKAAIEKVLKEHFLPLKEGCSLDEAKRHADVMVPFAAKIKLDESLLVTLPAYCKKSPSERGEFDQMVTEQLEEQMQQKIAELGDLIVNGEKQKADNEAAVQAARRNSEVATERRRQALSELEGANSSQCEAASALEAAKSAVADFEPECRQAADSVKTKKAALETFTSVNVASFERLRNSNPAGSTETVESSNIEEAS